MNQRDLLLLGLRRQDLDFQSRLREALIHVEDSIRKNDLKFAKQLLSEFVFCEKSGRINSTQETQLTVVLLSDFFSKDDPSKIPFFFNVFEPGKNSRKNSILLKFILTGIAIQSSGALNASGTFLLDPLRKEFRISADFGRLLINEITIFANNSIEKLKSLALLSPLFVNSLCLIFAETFKEEQLPTPIIASLVTEFVQSSSPPFIYCFMTPQHVEVGALILASFYRWTCLSELYETKSSYSKLHLKILECMSSVDPVTAKPIVYTKYLETIIDLILRSVKAKGPDHAQRSLEKVAQLVQVSKTYLYGNIPLLIERLSLLPKNSLLELVIKSIK